MGKAKARSLVDDVLGRAKNHRPGFQAWFAKLPPEAQAELEQVREAFDPAVHQKNAYATAVIAACAERGWQTSGRQGVINWLSAKR